MGKVIKKEQLGLGEASVGSGLAEGTPRPGAQIISRDTVEARSEAHAIRERALLEANEIHKQAELEAEKIKEQAYQLGFSDGKNAGAAELSEIVIKTSARLGQIEAQIEPQLRVLALTIARKILGRELESDPALVVDIVKQALSEKARQRREIFLRVNPEDLKIVREKKAELLEVLSRAKEIGIREDPAVERFGVIIETDAGTIDAQLETQLGVFERVLKETGR